MPTFDIKADFGAAGNGQKVTATAVLSLSTPTLFSVTSNIFTTGDVGKKLAIAGAIATSDANPLGALLTTISSVSAFAGGVQTAFFSDSATVAISSASTLLEWGSNDNAAFTSFNGSAAGLSGVILNVPAGRYCFASAGSGNGMGFGVPELTIQGAGTAAFADMLGGGNGFFMGSVLSVLFNDNTKEAKIQTVSAGTSTLTLVTASQTSIFSANTWAWMTGFDDQGFGSPPNPQFGEFVFITAIGSGSVTIQTPLRNSYKSTWPAWVLGSPTAFSLGGPATLYSMEQNWSAAHIYNDIIFESNATLFNCNARNVTINRGSSEVYGPNVSMQESFSLDSHNVPTQWEFDKGTTSASISNCTVHAFVGFSSWPENLTLNNVTIQTFANGFPNKTTISNCTFQGTEFFGTQSYGADSSLTVSNTVFAARMDTITGIGEQLQTNGYSMSGGVIQRARAGGDGGPPQWAIPGFFCFFGSRYQTDGGLFKVIDVTADATNIYIQTDQAGGFPTIVSPATANSVNICLPPSWNFSGCTGADEFVVWSANPSKRLGQYWLTTYNGNIGTSQANIRVWGTAVQVKITVGAGYTAGTFNLDSPFVVQKPQNVETNWTPVIDLTAAGTRTILPSGVTGTAGSDTGLALPNNGNVWIVPNQITPKMTSALGPGTVTLEIVTNQGFPIGTVGLLGLRR